MPPNHDASASAVGYLHQIDWAFVEMLKSGRSRPDQAMMLEKFDDVSWQIGEDPTELLQLKHHATSTKNLTNSSVDLWKTIKVWLDDPKFRATDGPLLCLVTTAEASEGSAAALLRPSQVRATEEALEQLNSAATESTNDDTAAARLLWLQTKEHVRLGIAERINILDGGLRITDLEEAREAELFWAAPGSDRYRLFDEQLTGWWHRVAIDLLNKSRGPVTVTEVRSRIETMRDQYSKRSLPTTVARPPSDEVAGIVSSLTEELFVKQLEWIRASPNVLEKVTIDFYRTVAQTTAWMSSNLIEMHELQSYRDDLSDAWDYEYNAVLRRLPDDASDVEKQDLGYDLFEKLRNRVNRLLRPEFNEGFYQNGVYCEIANTGRHGWHPDFAELVEALTVGSNS